MCRRPLKILESRGDAELIDGALGAGVGRVTHGLVALGHAVTAVDVSPDMLAEIRGATTVCAEIEGFDLDRSFEGVVRRAFLATCARHVARGGLVFLECHTSSLLERARPGLAHVDRNGVRISWLEVVRHGRSLTGTLEYRFGENVWTQTFTTEVLEDPAIRSELARCGLRYARSLTDNWIVAKPL